MVKNNSRRGWLVLICALIVTFVFQGLVSHHEQLLLEPITTSLGMDRVLYSSLDSLTPMTNVVLSFFLAATISKLGQSLIIKIGSFGAVAYCVFLYFAGTLSNMTLIIICIALANITLGVYLSWTSIVLVSVLINNWFAKRRGLIISITQTAAGLSGSIFATVISNNIINSGWESSLVWRGVICLIGSIFICMVLRIAPGANEVRVWEDEAEEVELVANKEASTGLTFKEALRTYQFYFGVLLFFLGTAVGYSPTLCLAAFATDMGFVEHVGIFMSITFAVSMIVTLPLGSLFEKFGARKILLAMCVVNAVGALILGFNPNSLSSYYIAAVCFGVSFCFMTVPVPMYVKDVFGDKDFAKIQSIIFSLMIFGCVVGYPLFNVVFEASGSYASAYIYDAVGVVVMAIVAIIATNKIKA